MTNDMDNIEYIKEYLMGIIHDNTADTRDIMSAISTYLKCVDMLNTGDGNNKHLTIINDIDNKKEKINK